MFSLSQRPTITEIHKLYETKKATPSQVVQFFLNRIKEIDKKILAYDHLTENFAMKIAKEQDTILNQQEWQHIIKKQSLFGIPFANKAIIQVEGQVFNGGSSILNNLKSPYSSTAYLNVAKAGAIMIGICNMDAHAMGSSGETSSFGLTKNPFDTSRICGGSSSGSAGAVASGQAVFSLGTDTGGSIRQPASFTDLVGLKPTYGLVSRWGTQPMASSLDQVGAFTNCVEDNIVVTSALAGQDKKDQTSIDSTDLVSNLKKILQEKNTAHRTTTKLTRTNKPLRIGLPKQFYVYDIDPVIKNRLDEIKNRLVKIGHSLVEVDIPITKDALSIYYMTCSVEVSSNLQRIDGVRFGKQESTHKNDKENDKEEMFFDHRDEFFPDEAKRRIMLGSYASSAGYYDAYYNQSQKVRAVAMEQFAKAFEVCDVMLVPTTPEFPFKIGEKSDDPISMYLSDIFTCLINPIKIPALNVPMGLLPYTENNIPIFDDTTDEDKLLPKDKERKRAVAIINLKGTDKFVIFNKNGDKTEFYNDTKAKFLPGGMIEEGETAIEASARETEEEIGLQELELIGEIGTCRKYLKYEDVLANGLETYILFQVTTYNWQNRIKSEAEDKGYTVELASIQELRQNNWNQLNWVMDIIEEKIPKPTSKTIMLPAGCQVLGKILNEDIIYTLALDIEQIIKDLETEKDEKSR
jgi:aspartyl-tRNA(Asn)/glutamyl-tRNA(Gln) amidotransferase subunit A